MHNIINAGRRSSADENKMLEEVGSVIHKERGDETITIRNKRVREDDEGEWTVVERKEKRIKPEKYKVEIYISSNEQMPKQ